MGSVINVYNIKIYALRKTFAGFSHIGNASLCERERIKRSLGDERRLLFKIKYHPYVLRMKNITTYPR